jgi:hypothetical protein
MATNVSNNMNQQTMDTNTAAAILSQFDQNTQLQALAMLRQLNAQQQLQQIQQLQQLQQLQNLQRMSQQPSNQVSSEQKRVISCATRPAKMAQISSASHYTSGNCTKSTYQTVPQQQQKPIIVQEEEQIMVKPVEEEFQPIIKELGPDGVEFIVPSDDMIDQIIIASEYYFSDENLAKDHYLLRQICQKSEGFLSVKLLTALKNVKRLTKDWRVTSYALKKSKNLELNNEFTKVKRVACLPEQVLKARQITNVIAIKIPMEFSSVSSITQLFAQYGKITLVRVLLPGRQVPCDLRNYATQVPDMGNSLCAVVEYETEAEACTACRELNSKRYNSGLRSALLGPRLRRNLYKALPEGEETTGVDSTLQTTNNAWNKAVVVDGKSTIAKSKEGTSTTSTKKDSGCDSASHTSMSVRKPLNISKKSVAMKINISQNTSTVIRQPKGPSGSGFKFARTNKIEIPSVRSIISTPTMIIA